jgi:hypothetical protein
VASVDAEKGAHMSEETRTAGSTTVELVHGAFAEAVLEVGGDGR